MSFPRYPAYKPSGVEWLGEVPEHWASRRLGFFFAERREKVSDKDFQALSVTKDGIVPQLDTAAKTDDGDNRKCVRTGDFVINSRSDRKGSSGLSRLDGSVSLICTVLRPQESVQGGFIHHLLRSVSFQEEFYRFGKGIVADLWSTNYSAMSGITLAMPPLEEQESIATFLDRETAKIDALIAEQKRLIELLQEKRQAVISHAVTKGLNPNAPMKDSGVEWLGEVPEHWEVKKLRYVCKIQTGSRDTEEAVEDGEYSFFVRSQTVERINSYSYDCEAVLTAGDGAGVGKVFHYYTGPFDFHQRVYMLNDFNGIHGKLIYHFLKTNFFKVALQGGAKSTVDSLRRPMFTGFPVCIPPKDEQGALLEHVETEEEKIGKLMETSEKAVSLLQERRSALISAAVTGQIDVRGLAEAEAGEQ